MYIRTPLKNIIANSNIDEIRAILNPADMWKRGSNYFSHMFHHNDCWWCQRDQSQPHLATYLCQKENLVNFIIKFLHHYCRIYFNYFFSTQGLVTLDRSFEYRIKLKSPAFPFTRAMPIFGKSSHNEKIIPRIAH